MEGIIRKRSAVIDSLVAFVFFPSLLECVSISKHQLWNTVWPYYSTETAFRSLDVTGDGIEDVIVGFATGVTRPNAVACLELFLVETAFCGGGIAALDGLTGHHIWRTFSHNEVYALTCLVDIDGDGIYDCVGAGRMSTMLAVSSSNGGILWTVEVSPPALISISNFYTAQAIHDVDGDGVDDFLNINGGDPFKKKGQQTRFSARIVIVSSVSGKILQWTKVPDEIESYNSPQILRYKNGTQMLLFGTGGETTPGSLWAVDLIDMIATRSMRTARKILHDDEKGFMVPPILVDINLDGVRDIVLSPFGSRVFALSGVDFSTLWKYEEKPPAETYSTPAAGFFDKDDIPDIIVQFSHGPGFPIYSDSVVRVLNGKTGLPFKDSTRHLIAVQSSPLTLAFEGYGNDMFVYAVCDCEGHEDNVPMTVTSSNVSTYKLSRTNMCKVRFEDAPKMNTRIYAMSEKTGTPGIEIYNSIAMRHIEYSQAAMQQTARRITSVMRNRRHVGAHDGDGLLRTISTGMISGANESGVLFTFAAFWSYNPVPTCVENKLKLEIFRFNTSSMKDQDHDAFKETAEEECGSEPDIQGDLMSQTTIYRVWLEIRGAASKLKRIQPWPEYMGSLGDSYL